MPHIEHLHKDKKLRTILIDQEKVVLEKRKNICLQLCKCIMSQQLSTAVATVFHRRFLELFSGKEPGAKQILQIPFETLRGIGLSNAKANYVHEVARFFIEEKLTDAALQKMENEELISCLTRIKGVGNWTAEMILMFSMAREDVFAVDDLGIQQAIASLYNLNLEDKKQLKIEMQKIATRWSPYRTYACYYLWQWKDS